MTVPAPAAVPRTGQTSYFPLNTAPTGSDGDLQKGVAWPNPRFTDNGSGTITDNLTRLIRYKDANRFGSQTWHTALNECNNLSDEAAGLTDGSVAGDWHLANVKEYQSLFHYGTFNPAVPDTLGTCQWGQGDPFNNVRSVLYWSSNTVAQYPNHGWIVSFNNGHSGFTKKEINDFSVWCVRDGQ